MKKEDFKVGHWYTSSQWVSTSAAKFDSFTSHFNPSERINSDGIHSFTSNSLSGDLISFLEVPVDSIWKYLPKNHPDLEPLYLECIKDNSYDNGANGIGKIFEVKTWLSKNTVQLKGASSSVSASRFKFSTKEAFEAQENRKGQSKDIVENFPTEGYCTDMSQEMIDFISSKGRGTGAHVEKEKQRALVWNKDVWWKGTISFAESHSYVKFPSPFLSPTPSVPSAKHTTRFKKGDTVFISNKSSYYKQGIDRHGIKQPGEIVSTPFSSSSSPYMVSWKNLEGTHFYSDIDLISEEERRKEEETYLSLKKFKEKDVVFINSESELVNQGMQNGVKMVGVVSLVRDPSLAGDFNHSVRWSNGASNLYRLCDLISLKEYEYESEVKVGKESPFFGPFMTKEEKTTLETLQKTIPKIELTLLVEPVHSTKVPLSTKKKSKYFNI